MPTMYRGWVKGQLRDYHGAKADYSRAIELKPDYADAYGGRGDTWDALGDKQRANADRQKARDLRESNPR